MNKLHRNRLSIRRVRSLSHTHTHKTGACTHTSMEQKSHATLDIRRHKRARINRTCHNRKTRVSVQTGDREVIVTASTTNRCRRSFFACFPPWSTLLAQKMLSIQTLNALKTFERLKGEVCPLNNASLAR